MNEINPVEKENLEAAYLDTNYIVVNGQHHIVIRIGETNAVVDQLLETHQSRMWAFITAYNPLSLPLSDEENKIRQKDLIKKLEKNNFQFLNGYGQSSQGGWQAEPSVFIFDIDQETAIHFGKSFEQNAIVTGQIYKPSSLIWC